MYSLSFVIRAYNEKDKLRELIESIRAQDYPQELIELIVVDNGSSDGTAELTESLGARVVHLAQKDFTYPKSLNVGCAVAKHDILVIVSAHCLLWKKDSLRKSVKHFDNQKVAGLYGPLLPRKPYTVTQWAGGVVLHQFAKLRGIRHETKARMGILGNTNAMLRRQLWLEHHFNEAYAMGAEDMEWAAWALQQGYEIIRDPAFTVRHSHYLGFWDSIRQHRFWQSIKDTPRAFDPEELSFRKDINRDPK